MNRLAWVLIAAALCACVSEPPTENPQPSTGETPPPKSIEAPPRGVDVHELMARLGLQSDPRDLGFNQRIYNGCKLGMTSPGEACGIRYLSVIHFRLICRDTDDTTESVPTNLTPLTTDQLEYRLPGARGITSTDSGGYGEIAVVTRQSIKSQKFILVLGRRSLGLEEAGEVTQILLPNEWCASAANSRSSHRLDAFQDGFGDSRIAGQ